MLDKKKMSSEKKKKKRITSGDITSLENVTASKKINNKGQN